MRLCAWFRSQMQIKTMPGNARTSGMLPELLYTGNGVWEIISSEGKPGAC
jgi:hypothetical protein